MSNNMIKVYTLKEIEIKDDDPYGHCEDCNANFIYQFEACPHCGGDLTGYCNLDLEKTKEQI